MASDAARAVFDHSQIGMAVLDSTGALTETNPALRRLLGFDRDALVGRPLSSLVDRAHYTLCVSTVETLVAAILGFAEMLQRSFDEDDPRAADVRQIIREGRRAAALTEELLAFGRKQTRHPTVLDLNALLTSLEARLRLTIRGDMRLDTQLAQDLWPVTADEVQIERVIMNLALNSRDAMPTGGRLTIRTANVMLDDQRVRKHPPLLSGPYAMVAVTDTGFGIDAETRPHLFEPFFTTKEQGKGTGMGLASAYGIIKQNGGFIEVESEVGSGSTFTFYLPSAAMPASHPAPATAATTPPAKS